MPFKNLLANVQSGADLLDSMSNPARLRILCLLAVSEIAVGALAETMGLSQSVLSQHLAKLRALKLVSTRRDAQTIYYKCEHPGVPRLLMELTEIFTTQPAKFAA